MTTTSIKFDDKADLIKALKAQRPAMVQRDREAKVEHAEAEKRALADFRAEAKRLTTLSYAQVKEEDRRRNFYVSFSAPACPILWTPRLDIALSHLRLTSQKAFTVNPGSDLWDLLTFGEPKLSPC